jgi:hypothetical protein
MVAYCYWQYLASSFHVLSFLTTLEKGTIGYGGLLLLAI